MQRVAQLGIAIGSLGAMVALMGLFPGFTGLEPTPGIGLVQLIGILIGFNLLMLGAVIYVKFSFYAAKESNLVQQIGIRLTWTGMVLAIMSGLADTLGFGSHGAEITRDIFLGPLQALGIVGSYLISSLGVLIYALGGRPEEFPEAADTTTIYHVEDDEQDHQQEADLVQDA